MGKRVLGFGHRLALGGGGGPVEKGLSKQKGLGSKVKSRGKVDWGSGKRGYRPKRSLAALIMVRTKGKKKMIEVFVGGTQGGLETLEGFPGENSTASVPGREQRKASCETMNPTRSL